MGNEGDSGKTDCRISLGEAAVTYPEFIVDEIIFFEELKVHVHALDTLSIELRPHGLNVSWIKKNIQEFIALFVMDIDFLPPVTVHEEYKSFVEGFVYL